MKATNPVKKKSTKTSTARSTAKRKVLRSAKKVVASTLAVTTLQGPNADSAVCQEQLISVPETPSAAQTEFILRDDNRTFDSNNSVEEEVDAQNGIEILEIFKKLSGASFGKIDSIAMFKDHLAGVIHEDEFHKLCEWVEQILPPGLIENTKNSFDSSHPR